MSPELLIAILNFATKFGLEAAIEILKVKPGTTIDEAIAALERAKTKTAQDYLDEAKRNLPPASP